MSWLGPVLGGLMGLLGGQQQQGANQAAQQGQQQAAAGQQQGMLQQGLAGMGSILRQNPSPIAGFHGFQGPQANPFSGQGMGGGVMGQGGQFAQPPQMGGAQGMGGSPGGMTQGGGQQFNPQIMAQMIQKILGGQSQGGPGQMGGFGNIPNAPNPFGPSPSQGLSPIPNTPNPFQQGGGQGFQRPGAIGGFQPFPVAQLGQQLAQNYQPPSAQQGRSVSLG